MKKLALIVALTAIVALGQDAKDDEVVSVPKRYVSPEGLSHQQEAGVSKWIGIGREVGIATREGLTSVVDVSEKFGGTNVGRFVMVMVAWRIIGKDLTLIVFGVPLWLFGVWVWAWSMRRFFFGYRAVQSFNKETKEKTFTQVAAYKFQGDEARCFCGVAHTFAIAIMVIILFAVIL